MSARLWVEPRHRRFKGLVVYLMAQQILAKVTIVLAEQQKAVPDLIDCGRRNLPPRSHRHHRHELLESLEAPLGDFLGYVAVLCVSLDYSRMVVSQDLPNWLRGFPNLNAL